MHRIARVAAHVTIALGALVFAWLAFLAVVTGGGILFYAVFDLSSAMLLASAAIAFVGGRRLLRGASHGAELGAAAGAATALATLLDAGDLLFAPWNKVALAVSVVVFAVNIGAWVALRPDSRRAA